MFTYNTFYSDFRDNKKYTTVRYEYSHIAILDLLLYAFGNNIHINNMSHMFDGPILEFDGKNIGEFIAELDKNISRIYDELHLEYEEYVPLGIENRMQCLKRCGLFLNDLSLDPVTNVQSLSADISYTSEYNNMHDQDSGINQIIDKTYMDALYQDLERYSVDIYRIFNRFVLSETCNDRIEENPNLRYSIVPESIGTVWNSISLHKRISIMCSVLDAFSDCQTKLPLYIKYAFSDLKTHLWLEYECLGFIHTLYVILKKTRIPGFDMSFVVRKDLYTENADGEKQDPRKGYIGDAKIFPIEDLDAVFLVNCGRKWALSNIKEKTKFRDWLACMSMEYMSFTQVAKDILPFGFFLYESYGFKKMYEMKESHRSLLIPDIDISLIKKKSLRHCEKSEKMTAFHIKEHIDKFVIGQERAKKALAVAGIDHYMRMTGNSDTTNNVFIFGPTGCGKTYMVEKLAEFLNVPFVFVDASQLNVNGYKGESIKDVIRKAIISSNKNRYENPLNKSKEILTSSNKTSEHDQQNAEAEIDFSTFRNAIIYIDEADKLCVGYTDKSRNDDANLFIYRTAVQQEFLKMLEGTNVFDSSNDKHQWMFIFSGAFTDMYSGVAKRLNKTNTQSRIGFNREIASELNMVTTTDKSIIENIGIDDFIDYGVIRELMGRISTLAPLYQLEFDDFKKIIKESSDSELYKFQKYAATFGIDIDFAENAIDEIVRQSMKKNIGARALKQVISDTFRDFKYHISSLVKTKILVSKEDIQNPDGMIKRILAEDQIAKEKQKKNIEAEYGINQPEQSERLKPIAIPGPSLSFRINPLLDENDPDFITSIHTKDIEAAINSGGGVEYVDRADTKKKRQPLSDEDMEKIHQMAKNRLMEGETQKNNREKQEPDDQDMNAHTVYLYKDKHKDEHKHDADTPNNLNSVFNGDNIKYPYISLEDLISMPSYEKITACEMMAHFQQGFKSMLSLEKYFQRKLKLKDENVFELPVPEKDMVEIYRATYILNPKKQELVIQKTGSPIDQSTDYKTVSRYFDLFCMANIGAPWDSMSTVEKLQIMTILFGEFFK